MLQQLQTKTQKFKSSMETLIYEDYENKKPRRWEKEVLDLIYT